MDDILSRFYMKGKNVMVTGAAGGIGSCCAIAFAQAGANVLLVDRKDAESVAEEIRGMGGQSIWYQADLTKEDQVTAVFDRAEQDFGPVHSLFNNAGVCLLENCEDMTYAQWREVMAVNMDASFLVAREAGRRMIRNGIHGTIVNTGSMSGDIVNYPQKQVGYNVSKAGVIHMTKTLACEWAEYGIRVNCISPGYIETKMAPVSGTPQEFLDTVHERIPMGRHGQPDEVAGAVLYLASDASSYTNGCEILIDGGYCCY
ncbi:MAG: SDR family oxidoreductase [Lachnospiraceae bacterium]|nr:SDR family oxidoreductase [Lachnospiraceae bacterium]